MSDFPITGLGERKGEELPEGVGENAQRAGKDAGKGGKVSTQLGIHALDDHREFIVNILGAQRNAAPPLRFSLEEVDPKCHEPKTCRVPAIRQKATSPLSKSPR